MQYRITTTETILRQYVVTAATQAAAAELFAQSSAPAHLTNVLHFAVSNSGTGILRQPSPLSTTGTSCSRLPRPYILTLHG